MYPFSYTGLRLIHDQKVRDAMERTQVDAETAHHWLSRAYRRIVGFVGTLHTGKKTTANAAFLIGTEEKDLACRVVLTSFELHFYISVNEERGTKLFLIGNYTRWRNNPCIY